ncbi:hypothetical protein NPA31_005270 [Aurantimonas sp. MSK8Z-1]|uniref:hypothetical protein n=1 Tax=Mangrovibrevibacter kandeliae TaxID=2968473 RepID=UPI0021197873|nr:hypothetical protein [Aurantimonas sp. MSK8Z-1]MCW4114372.1 hypothetical protein [Aurantimonas sp. MSK8Z-1]
MPRKTLPPRLWLEPERRDRTGAVTHGATWIILDAGRKHRTGCGAGDHAGAAKKLEDYLIAKHAAKPLPKSRSAAEVAVADVLRHYLDVREREVAAPELLALRVDHLLEFWGDKTLDDIDTKSCGRYVQARRPHVGGARRELEDLRTAINLAKRDKLCREEVIVTLPPKPKPRSDYLERDAAAKLLWAAYRRRGVQTVSRGSRKGRKVVTPKRPLLHVARFILFAIYTGTRSKRIWTASFTKREGHPWIDVDNGVFYRGAPGETASDNKRAPSIRLPKRLLAHCRNVGVTAFAGHFYNNHEPFLNKNTPAYLRVASDLQIETFVSSNLSFPKMDHEAIVRSGLKELLVALDGVTQESYQKYRKGGRLDWAFANVRAIADAKKRLGLSTPYIRWQWLTFEHNVHEVEKGIEVAREVGFDAFNLATPNRVDQDDPTVHAIQYDGPEEHKSVVINPRPQGNFESDLEPYRNLIEARLNESALQRWIDAGGPEAEQPEDRTGDRCDWLHMAVISDAMGRIVPCCRGDYKDAGQFVFSTIDKNSENIMNSRLYQESRILMADPVAYKRATIGQKPAERTRCLSCPVRPAPQIGLGAVNSWLVWSNKPQVAEIGGDAVLSLTNWSRHRTVRAKYQTSRLSFVGMETGERFHNARLGELPGIGRFVNRRERYGSGRDRHPHGDGPTADCDAGDRRRRDRTRRQHGGRLGTFRPDGDGHAGELQRAGDGHRRRGDRSRHCRRRPRWCPADPKDCAGSALKRWVIALAVLLFQAVKRG